MNPRNPVQTFLNEAEDLSARIEEIALELDPDQMSSDLINQLFRAFHTLKGSRAMFGFETVAEFTHHVETVLDQVREGRLSLSKELISLILQSNDQIKALLDAARNNQPPPIATGEQIVAGLNRLLPLPDAAGKKVVPPRDQGGASNKTPAEDNSPKQTWQILFRPAPNLMASGTNPITLLNELRELGDCEIMANADDVPPLDQLQPDRCYLA